MPAGRPNLERRLADTPQSAPRPDPAPATPGPADQPSTDERLAPVVPIRPTRSRWKPIGLTVAAAGLIVGGVLFLGAGSDETGLQVAAPPSTEAPPSSVSPPSTPLTAPSQAAPSTTGRSTSSSTTARAASTTQAAATPTSVRPGPTSCRNVSFTPNSDDAASSIVAENMLCSEAEALVRKVGAPLGFNGDATAQADRFRCVGTGQEDVTQPMATYQCTNGTKKVTFTRT